MPHRILPWSSGVEFLTGFHSVHSHMSAGCPNMIVQPTKAPSRANRLLKPGMTLERMKAMVHEVISVGALVIAMRERKVRVEWVNAYHGNYKG